MLSHVACITTRWADQWALLVIVGLVDARVEQMPQAVPLHQGVWRTDP